MKTGLPAAKPIRAINTITAKLTARHGELRDVRPTAAWARTAKVIGMVGETYDRSARYIGRCHQRVVVMERAALLAAPSREAGV